MTDDKKQSSADAILIGAFATTVYIAGIAGITKFMEKAYGAMSLVASTKGGLPKTPSNPTIMFFILHVALIAMVCAIVIFT